MQGVSSVGGTLFYSPRKRRKNMKRKIAIALLSATIACCSAVGLAACVTDSGDNVEPFWTIETAYAEAQDLGYGGTLEEFLAQIQGEDGKDGQDGVGIANVIINDDGDLIVTLSDGDEINCGSVRGEQGAPGVGIIGAEIDSDGNLILYLSTGEPINCGKVVGSDGQEGTPGEPGQPGQPGEPGRGIQQVEINANGQLVITYSDGTSSTLDKVVGENGQNGADGTNGTDGKDGVGIQNIVINKLGELVITLSNQTELSLGNVMGANGQDGQDGKDGDSISGATINENGELVLTFVSGKQITVGNVVGADGQNGADGADGQDGKDGVGVQNIVINENGELAITLTNNSVLNLGNVMGANGNDGKDGASVTAAHIDSNGHLILTFNDKHTLDCGNVMGTDGVGIRDIAFNESGELIITMTDDSIINCGKIPVCVHQYSVWNTILEPTCTSIGYETRTCSICNNVEYNFFEKLDHTYGEWQDMIDTCTEHWQTRSCQICGDSQVREAEPAGHIFINGFCIICGEVDVDSIDLTYLDQFNGTYGYEFLGTLTNGEALQALYQTIDDEVKKFHVNTAIDALDDYILADIDIGMLGLSTDQALSVWKTYKDDNPLYYWLSNTVTYSGESITLLIEEDYANGKVRSYYNQLIEDQVEAYSSTLYEGANEYDIALAYHDAILTAVDYSYDESNQPEDSAWAHNIIGVFNGQGAVCEGYARTYQLLLNYSGIENIFVTGDGNGEEHAWNLVKMDDGNWYWCDLTWDDTFVGGLNTNWKWGISYNYFLVNDTQNTLIEEGGWQYGSAIAFLENHTYDTSTGSGIDFLYDLPERAEGTYSSDNIVLLDEISVDNMVLQVVGYNALELHEVTGEGHFDIPSTVNYSGKQFTIISAGGGDILSGICQGNITSVTIPDSIVFIWDHAFRTYSLQNIYVAEDSPKFTSKDGVLFTKSLYTLIQYPSANERTEYIIPDKTYILAYLSFENCQNLSKLTIGKNVNTLGMANWGGGYCDNAMHGFGGNTIYGELDRIYNALANDKEIIIAPENSIYSSDEIAIYEYNKTHIVLVMDKNITSYHIPNTVTNIESTSSASDVFYECLNLESFTVDDDHPIFFTSGGILYYKSNKDIACVPRDLKGDIAIPDGVTNIDDWAFYNRSNITSINIPYGVTSIGRDAFSNCSNLTSITIPDSVTSIGNYAFSGCSSLTSITIPDNVISLGYDVFSNCSVLTIYCEAISSSNGWSSNWNLTHCPVVWDCNNNNVADDNYIYIIVDELRYGIKDNVATVVKQYGNMSEIIIPTFIEYNGIKYDVTAIEEYAFSNYKSLASIIIPNSIVNIGRSAFSNCNGLTIYCETESQPSGWEPLWNENCPIVWDYNNNSIANDNSIYVIIDGIRYSLKDNMATVAGQPSTIMENVTIPTNVEYNGVIYSVTHIGNNAFYYTSISNVIIPDSVTSIGYGAFSGCNNLISITIPNSVTNIEKSAFSGCTKLIQIENGVSYVDKWVVACDSNVTSIVLREGTIGISNWAFSYCSSLESIIIPNSITSIGDNAFEGCTNLASITLSNNLTIIDSGVFYDCSNLTNISIPNSVTSIYSSVFYNCTSLTDIYFNGTMEAWNTINKSFGWDYGTGNYTVHCIDGDVAKS